MFITNWKIMMGDRTETVKTREKFLKIITGLHR